jgi:hypothetical protein
MAVKDVTVCWHLAGVSKVTAQRHSTILKQAMVLVSVSDRSSVPYNA